VGFCKFSNEPSGSKNAGNFLTLQVLYLVVALPEVDYSNAQLMNE